MKARAFFPLLAAGLGLAACSNEVVPEYRTSSGSLALSADDVFAFAADEDNGALVVVDVAARRSVATVKVGARPQHVLAATDGTVFVSNRGSRTVSVVGQTDLGWSELGRIAVGAEPTGLALSPDGKTLAVANSTSGTVSLVDVESRRVAGEIPVGGTPRAVAFKPGGALYVTDFYGRLLQANVSERRVEGQAGLGFRPRVGTKDGEFFRSFPQEARSPTQLQAMAVSPDGKRLYVVHAQAKDDVIHTGASGFVGTPSGGGNAYAGGPEGTPPVVAPSIATVDVEDNQPLAEEEGDAQDFPSPLLRIGGGRPVLAIPSAAVVHPSGKWLFVAHLGSDNVAVLSTARARFDDFRDPEQGIQSVLPVGSGPTGLALTSAGDLALVHNAFDHSISFIEQVSDSAGERLAEVARISIGRSPLPEGVQRGRKLFHSATDRRMTNPETGVTCATCHADGGRHDGRTWNFTEGPRNTPTLAYKEVLMTAPYHYDGAIADIPGFQVAIVERQGGIGLSPEDWKDLMDYLAALPEPDNPHAGAALDERQELGRRLFHDPAKANCVSCHSGAAFTDNQLKATARPFGSSNRIATPPLRGLFATAPYLHDGSAATVRDVLVRENTMPEHLVGSKLSAEELDALVAYVETL